MLKLSPEFLARNVRVALFWAAGILVSKGYIESSYVETVIGLVMSTVTWAWSLWGNRLVAKVNEIAGNENFVVIAPPEIAEQAPSASVVSSGSVTVTGPARVVEPIAAQNPEVNTVAR